MQYFVGKKITNTILNLLETGLQLPVLRSLPRYVDVVLTKQCNLACVFCKDYETIGAKQVTLESFEKLAQQVFPSALEVRFCSGGEPYLHQNLEEMLRIARRYRASTWVLSNGMLLTEKRARAIVREELVSRHGFSVDGINPSTVETIRVNAKLDLIIENIQRLIRIRKEEDKRKPKIIIRYALMRANIEELPEAIQFWGKLGVDRIDCNYLSLCNDLDRQESLYFHQDLTIEIFNKARRVAKHYPRLTLKLPPMIRQGTSQQRHPQKCTAPWDFIYITPDGRILPCYCSWGAISMGNIYNGDESFKEIWNDPAYQALRRTVNNDTVEKHYAYCAGCERRFGWDSLAAHLGDETWLRYLTLEDVEKACIVAHRRRKTEKQRQ